jgi:hypothetical protein
MVHQHIVLALKMATAMFAETLDNSQHSTRLNPESRSYTLIPSRKNLKTRIYEMMLVYILSSLLRVVVLGNQTHLQRLTVSICL